MIFHFSRALALACRLSFISSYRHQTHRHKRKERKIISQIERGNHTQALSLLICLILFWEGLFPRLHVLQLFACLFFSPSLPACVSLFLVLTGFLFPPPPQISLPLDPFYFISLYLSHSLISLFSSSIFIALVHSHKGTRLAWAKMLARGAVMMKVWVLTAEVCTARRCNWSDPSAVVLAERTGRKDGTGAGEGYKHCRVLAGARCQVVRHCYGGGCDCVCFRVSGAGVCA